MIFIFGSYALDEEIDRALLGREEDALEQVVDVDSPAHPHLHLEPVAAAAACGERLVLFEQGDGLEHVLGPRRSGGLGHGGTGDRERRSHLIGRCLDNVDHDKGEALTERRELVERACSLEAHKEEDKLAGQNDRELVRGRGSHETSVERVQVESRRERVEVLDQVLLEIQQEEMGVHHDLVGQAEQALARGRRVLWLDKVDVGGRQFERNVAVLKNKGVNKN